MTDLPEYLTLLRKNLTLNPSLEPKVTISALDWLSFTENPLSSSHFDVVILVDCIYYTSSIPHLVSLLKSVNTKKILCIYEKRDVGEPVVAQELFSNSICNDFDIVPVDSCDLDPSYICEEIVFLWLTKKVCK